MPASQGALLGALRRSYVDLLSSLAWLDRAGTIHDLLDVLRVAAVDDLSAAGDGGVERAGGVHLEAPGAWHLAVTERATRSPSCMFPEPAMVASSR